MSDLGGVRSVDGPELAVVDAGVGGEVDLEPAVGGVDLVVAGVEVVDAPLERSGQEAGKAEDAAVVVEAHGQEERSLCGEHAGGVQQLGAHRCGVPGRPQRVVEPDDQRGEVRTVVQGVRELVGTELGRRRAWPGQAAQRDMVIDADGLAQEPGPPAGLGRCRVPSP